MAVAKAESAQSAEDKLFSAAGDVKFPYVKFETVGDRVSGVYVGKFQSVSAKYGHTQENYVLIKADGSKVLVGGRNFPKGGDVKIIFGMDKIPLGAKMGFIFSGEKDTGKGNPAKLVEPKYLGEKDLDTYNKFKEMYNLEAVKEASSEEAVVEGVDEEEPTL